MPDIITLEKMKQTDVRDVDPSDLIDIRDVTVNTALPRDERLLDYLEQIKNPYCFKCGKAVIKVSFADTSATLEERLESYLLSL